MRRRIARRGSGITKNVDEFAGDEREIVSVLNVFKTSVDTINASSITSDMTIGANLNGGSLTIGAAGATNLFLRGSEVKINEAGGGTVFIGNSTSGTDINSNITNIGTTGLSATGRVNIGTGNNSTGSEIKIGALSLPNCYIRGNAISIADNGGEVFIAGGGLAANKRIRIGNGANGAETELHLGSSSLSRMYIKGGDIALNDSENGNVFLGNSHVTGNIAIGTNNGNVNGTNKIYIGSTNKSTSIEGNLTIYAGTSIRGDVTLGADSLTNPTAASTNITLGTANSVFRLYTPINPLYGYGNSGTGSGQIGYIGSVACSGLPATVDNGAYVFRTIYTSGIPAGVYIGNINSQMVPSSTVSIMTINLNNGGNSGLIRYGTNVIQTYRNADTYTWYSCATIFFTILNSTTSYTSIQPYSSGGSSVLQGCVLEYLRIA